MASLSASGAAGSVSLTGSGFTAGQRVTVSLGFSATGRRFNEMRTVVADGSGAISASLPVPFGGNVTLKAITQTDGAVQATSGTATVT